MPRFSVHRSSPAAPVSIVKERVAMKASEEQHYTPTKRGEPDDCADRDGEVSTPVQVRRIDDESNTYDTEHVEPMPEIRQSITVGGAVVKTFDVGEPAVQYVSLRVKDTWLQNVMGKRRMPLCSLPTMTAMKNALANTKGKYRRGLWNVDSKGQPLAETSIVTVLGKEINVKTSGRNLAMECTLDNITWFVHRLREDLRNVSDPPYSSDGLHVSNADSAVADNIGEKTEAHTFLAVSIQESLPSDLEALGHKGIRWYKSRQCFSVNRCCAETTATLPQQFRVRLRPSQVSAMDAEALDVIQKEVESQYARALQFCESGLVESNAFRDA